MEQGSPTRADYPADKTLRDGGIQHQFENLERELVALTEALNVHAGSIENVLRGSDPQSPEESLARLADAGISSTASRLRDRTEQVTELRHKLENLTKRLDF